MVAATSLVSPREREVTGARPTAVLSFPPFRLDLTEERLWKGSVEVHLRPKPFAILRYLAEHPRELVRHEDLVAAVWGKVAMSDSLLRSHILALRHALGAGIVETVVGRGYRFVAEVERSGAAYLPPAAAAPPGASEQEQLHAPSVATLESDDDDRLTAELRLDCLRQHVAIVRAIADQIDQVARPQDGDGLGDQLVEALARLGCEVFEAAAAMTRTALHHDQEPLPPPHVRIPHQAPC